MKSENNIKGKEKTDENLVIDVEATSSDLDVENSKKSNKKNNKQHKKIKPLKVINKQGRLILQIVSSVLLLIFIVSLILLCCLLFDVINFNKSNPNGNLIALIVFVSLLILCFVSFLITSVVLKVKFSNTID